jgi:hypothetical protein
MLDLVRRIQNQVNSSRSAPKLAPVGQSTSLPARALAFLRTLMGRLRALFKK